MTVKNTITGFHNTGIYPPDREAVKVDMASNHKSLEESSGLAYIPLYTPRYAKEDLHFKSQNFDTTYAG